MKAVTRAGLMVRPSLLDRLVGVIDPARGLARLHARAMLSAATAGYKGGRRDRRPTREWRPKGGSADADTLPDLPDLRARARDLARNTPIATGAIATTVTNVVGDGLQLQAAVDREILGLTDQQADAWERAAEREWRHYCTTADFSRVQTFEELQVLVFRAALESGDVLVVRRYRQDAGDLYGTKLQVIEADRLSNPRHAADTSTISGGVEVDKDGAPVAYHLSDRHPGTLRAGPLTWTRVAARTRQGKLAVIHLYDRMRPEQTRGVPYLAPVIEHLKQLGDYSDAEVTAAVISAMYTVFIKSTADQTQTAIAGETDTTTAANEVKLGNGAIISLDPNEEAQFPSPMRPNAQFDPFVQAFLRQVGVALELPFELLVKHFTASYSASRAALEMAWQFFRKRRIWLARRFCQVVYEWVIEEAVARGRLVAPDYFSDPLIAQAYCGSQWIGPNRASIDPKKEAEADEIDLRLGTKTRAQICMERTGGEWEIKHRQLVKEETQRRDAGLSAPPPAAPVQPPDTSGDDGADNGDLEDESAQARRAMP